MDKKSPNRTMRQAKVLEDWNCSACTYRNSAEVFRCLMCQKWKGSLSRTPHINTQLSAPQVTSQFTSVPLETIREGSEDNKHGSGGKSSKKTWRPPRHKNVDRSSAQTLSITVNNVTVVITEYKAKKVSAPTAVTRSVAQL